MKRRDFLRSSAAVAGASLTSRLGFNKLWAQNTTVGGSRPNILLILVDELRYPTVFPDGIMDASGFFSAFMPNLYKRLWTRGVKFGEHHTASNACTPARGTIITGLYSQQSWLFMTIVAPPNPGPILANQPVLNPAYPTYGSLLQQMFKYQTPYRGKWHVSIPQQNKGGLLEYGFDYDTYPDPTGANLQGTYGDEKRGFHNDEYIANQAIGVLQNLKPSDQPFCLTVSFVNPHDREFFPWGTEFRGFNRLFKNGSINPNKYDPSQEYPGDGPKVPWGQDKLKDPPEFGYKPLPPNWETEKEWAFQNKPSTQTLIKDFSNLTWGGATEDPQQNDFTIAEYKATNLNPLLGVAYGPFSYWRRGLDSYTQIIEIVDEQIGAVLDQLEALPQSIVDNTIIVFCSDHGEYAGAHGLLQGKLGTNYEEAWHVPLIVVDPSGRFTGDIDDIRLGLTSSVDLLPMLVTLANRGSTDWMTGDLAAIYGQRHDLVPMLKRNDAPGRPYVLFATDEIVPNAYNFNSAPTHVLGFRTDEYKFGISAPWFPATSDIIVPEGELEFYDYSTTRGQLELDNNLTDPRVKPTLAALLTNIIPNEMQQLLPGSLLNPKSLRAQQAVSKARHLAYRAILENIDPQDLAANGGLAGLFGFGGSF